MTHTLLPPFTSAPAPSGPQPLRGLARTQASLGGARYADLIVGEVEGALTLGAVQRAAQALCARHAVLRARLRTAVDPAVWAGPIPDPLPVSVALGAWRAVAQDLLETPLEGYPVWRLVMVPGPGRTHLALAVHHALVDGRALSALLRDLLRALQPGVALGRPLPLAGPPPLAPLGRVPGALARWAWAVGTRRMQRATPLRGGPVLGEGRPALFDARELAPGLLGALAVRARGRGATVGGALAASAWEATRELARARGTRSGRRGAPVQTMVDLRPLLGEAPEVGMYASGALALGTWASEDPWARARAATGRVRWQLARGTPLWVHRAVDGVGDAARWLEARGVDLVADGGCGAVSQVSSGGAWAHGEVFGALRLRGVWSAAAPVRTGPALLGWLRTVDGRGCLSAVGNGAVLSSGELRRWMDRVAHNLADMEAR